MGAFVVRWRSPLFWSLASLASAGHSTLTTYPSYHHASAPYSNAQMASTPTADAVPDTVEAQTEGAGAPGATCQFIKPDDGEPYFIIGDDIKEYSSNGFKGKRSAPYTWKRLGIRGRSFLISTRTSACAPGWLGWCLGAWRTARPIRQRADLTPQQNTRTQSSPGPCGTRTPGPRFPTN